MEKISADVHGKHAIALARAQRAQRDGASQVKHRWYPSFHIAPPAGWMNDPNGVAYFKGTYHVFYQHHPFSPEWGPMHWGHVSSEDLVHWKHESIALAPSLVEDSGGCWSGSAIEAPNGDLAVIYTGNQWLNGVDDREGKKQSQILALSADGIHFEKYGVVLKSPEGIEDFRDPKIWRDGSLYRMVIGVGVPVREGQTPQRQEQVSQQRGQVWLYESDDLIHWEFVQVLYEDPDPLVSMIECPDFIYLGGKWVLIYGALRPHRLRGYAFRNGHNMGYVSGTWSPRENFAIEGEIQPLDWGHDYYAGQTLRLPDPDRRLIVFAWMGGFSLPLASQREDGWSGQLALPRELCTGVTGNIVAKPIAELEKLRCESKDYGSFEIGVNETLRLADNAQCVEIECDVDLDASSSETIAMLVQQTSDSHYVLLAYDSQSQRVVLDRGVTSRTNRGKRSAPAKTSGVLSLRIFLDRASIEVFIDGGERCISSLTFPCDVDEARRAISLASVNGTIAVRRCVIHSLASAVS
ncbi:MAG: GH32 C-terminal domain-containing protein [Actinomycetaceae bacterium]|nr:GH32 C-terminal domain-containing protein [Arcanobacterium sp.]MDD7686618.1 GH32 C-terminal domain-containing protein [Actinomycetaceae bacterium]